ncbi:MAG TPA: ferritin-like domain-containing protein, partial [Myxococcales bacterium]|nr:ferritin-like domain-containing protein [Myxococcales bacterium]
MPGSAPVLPSPAEPLEPFELCLLGGSIERRYRRMRPEVDGLPWGTLDPTAYSRELVLLARRSWTEAAFQEHRTGAACAAALQALIAARAPLDLIAVGSRFPLDELVHVELCARLATELGGGAPLLHDPRSLIPPPRPGQGALMTAAELMVRFFCVGEAVSVPLLRGTWRAATHPLVRAVLGRIVKDEAAHGELGFW